MTVQVNRIYRGPDDTDPKVIDPNQANAAFQSAIASLPTQGGFELYVTPGSDVYRFAAEVVVDRPNLTINFSPGAQLTFKDTVAQNMLLIRAPNFRCKGARVVHSITNLNHLDERSVFRVDDMTSPNSTDGASFADCVFHVDQMVLGIKSFSCIRAMGASGTSPRRGLDVRGCTFHFPISGIQQTNAWSGADPYGICAIRTRRTRSCLLSRNLFFGIDSASRSHCGPMLYLEDSPDAVISSNVFRLVNVKPATIGTENGTVIRLTRGISQEGLHAVLAANTFENIGAQFAIELIGTSGDVVAFSNFGRILTSDAAIRASPIPGQMTPSEKVLVVVGNNFHNVQPNFMVSLERVGDVTIAGNVLFLWTPDDHPFAFETRSCENVHVAAGQTWRRPII